MEVYEDLLNELSQGKPVAEDIQTLFREGHPSIARKKFDDKFLEVISGTSKRIYLENSPYGRADHEALEISKKRIRRSQIIQSVQESRRKYDLQGAYDKKRDVALCDQVINIIRKNPDANILVMRGAIHERTVAKLLHDSGQTFRSYHPHEPYLIPICDDIQSKVEAGEPVTRKDFLMADVQSTEMIKRSYDPSEGEVNPMVLRQIDKSIREMSEKELVRYLSNIEKTTRRKT